MGAKGNVVWLGEPWQDTLQVMPTVTVLIPTFNRQHMIANALQGVWAQTYTDYEVIVVDDGSTDNTEQFLKPWMSKIRYLKKENGGPSSARNVGLRQIRTDFVAFLDSDDQWEPTHLQVVLEKFADDPRLGLVTTARLEMPSGNPRPRLPASSVQGDLYPLLFLRNFITTSGTLVKRECFDTVGLFKEDLMQVGDYDMWLRIARTYPIAFVKEHRVQYGCHAHNISKNELRHKLCLQKVLQANYEPERVSEEVLRIRQAEVLKNMGRIYLRHSEKFQARQCFRQSLRLRPRRIRVWRYFLMTWL